MTKEFKKTASGVLFDNHQKKTKDTQPDFTGTIEILEPLEVGTKYFISAWNAVSKNTGTEFISLSLGGKVTAKEGKAEVKASPKPVATDNIGF